MKFLKKKLKLLNKNNSSTSSKLMLSLSSTMALKLSTSHLILRTPCCLYPYSLADCSNNSTILGWWITLMLTQILFMSFSLPFPTTNGTSPLLVCFISSSNSILTLPMVSFCFIHPYFHIYILDIHLLDEIKIIYSLACLSGFKYFH